MDEPLATSAALARRLALQLCRTDPLTGSSCAWLHGFWQCLRILGLAADPGRHAPFYLHALAETKASAGAPRVLVSGAADYSMLAHALAAFRARAVEPAMTVIDRCETPLCLNRWYADRVGCTLASQRASMLDYTPDAPFDAICTHSFLGMFAPAERARLVGAWHRALRPGGRLVTAHPLRPWGPDEPNRFSAGQAQAFRAAVAERADEIAGLLGSSAAEVASQAERYLGATYGYPVRSVDELRRLFSGGGFVLEHLESAAPPSSGPRETGGPGLRNAAVRYAHVIAVRR
jgi:SAM-dependent methyltransferase